MQQLAIFSSLAMIGCRLRNIVDNDFNDDDGSQINFWLIEVFMSAYKYYYLYTNFSLYKTMEKNV